MNRPPLPVTILSGFLGTGKTTLLQNILKSNHGLRIAVIVNDIGSINVDANLIDYHTVTRPEEKVIRLQNGCICCTLRGDLLEEIVRLCKSEKFDAIIIESSGISEPEQVAETFDGQLAEQLVAVGDSGEGVPGLDLATLTTLKKVIAEGGLEAFAKIDTCVTVVDAYTILQDFSTEEFISSRRDDVEEQDEKTVSELLVDQIEFANVIILNKIDMIDPKTKADVTELIIRLNPDAKIIETSYGKVATKELLNTGKFDMTKAQLGYGWLQDLHRMTTQMVNGKNVVAPKTETEEYNVRNFVYRESRPFHPERLFQLLYETFILQHPEEEEEAEIDENEQMDMSDDDTQDEIMGIEGADSASPQPEEWQSPATRKSSATTAPSEGDDKMEDEPEDIIIPANEVIVANKRKHPVFSRLFRSKGEYFLATRPERCGEWSQAGAMLEMRGGREWFCTLPEEEYLSGDPEADALMKYDIASGGTWGDRRQEIVFIGVGLQYGEIQKLLDGCLLNDEEWKQWETIMLDDQIEDKANVLAQIFEDGFPDWLDIGHDHAGHDHSHSH